MKKFLLVVFIGMVLAINLYSVVKELISIYETNNVEEMNKGYIIVYTE